MLASCGSQATSAKKPESKHVSAKPEKILGVPANAIFLGPLQSNGEIAVLAGSSKSMGVFVFDLADSKELSSFSVSNTATSITELPNGVIGVGLANGSAGAVELYQVSGAKVATVPMSGPVISMSNDGNGSTILVLEGTTSVRAVEFLDANTNQATSSIPLVSSTVSVCMSGSGSYLYGLESGGIVDVYTVSTAQKVGEFRVGHSGISSVMSPSGSQMFVLKGRNGVRNVAVVDLNTESDVRALPAPAGSVSVVTDLAGKNLIELATISGKSNIQEWPVH